MKKISFLSISLLICANSLQTPSNEWSQWRGPKRDGILESTQIPQVWPEAPSRVWQIEIGEGHASPIILEDNIFIFTRKDNKETISCIDPTDGKIIWRNTYAAPYSMNFAAYSHGKGPKSTPAAANGRIITLGISGILSCYNVTDGKILWQKQFEDEFNDTSPTYGTAMSPMIVNGRCIVHAGGDNDGALISFDLETGKEVWRWDGDGPGYASPILATFDGTTQIVTFSQKHIIGIGLDDGKLLWQISFETPWEQNIQTPLLYENDLILSGLEQGIMRIKVRNESGSWKLEEVWKNKDMWAYMSSPVLMGDLIIVFSDKRKGVYATLDPQSGKVLWQSQGREGDNAALLSAGEYLFSLQTDGRFIIAKRDGSGLKLVKEYTVADSPTWAHPAFYNGKLLVKDKSTLGFWDF